MRPAPSVTPSKRAYVSASDDFFHALNPKGMVVEVPVAAPNPAGLHHTAHACLPLCMCVGIAM